MHDFVLKEIINSNIANELTQIGFDKSYIHKACEKYEYKNIKIFSLTTAQANILKQTAISVGCDCATHREVITAKIENCDCILGGSISQIKKIGTKLQHQPFKLKQLGEKLLEFTPPINKKKTKIVGILNLTPNSFSDGGEFDDYKKATQHLLKMIEQGVDIIDIGAESTKPYSQPVDDETQLSKLLPIIEFAKDKITISVDTRSAVVAEKSILAGASIINDVSGFDYDKNMAEIIAKYGTMANGTNRINGANGIKIIIQHSLTTPETMQENPIYENLVDEIYLSLKKKTDLAISKGIKKENIIIDVGIGFGKTRKDNFKLIRRIEEFRGLGFEVMLGVSRKSLLNMPDADNNTKDIFTMALNTLAVEKNIEYLRVHNVELHKQLIAMLSIE
ncbi:MAG: dihydropteroate synthase [Candidatus Gastranaerophilales bacterium]